MQKAVHICMGCGKDTTAKGGVCRQCFTMVGSDPLAWDVIDYEISCKESYRDDYELNCRRLD